MNTKHPNLDRIIEMINNSKNYLGELVNAYDDLKSRQESADDVTKKIGENFHGIFAYLEALCDSGFISTSLYKAAKDENLALFREALWANEEVIKL